MPTQKKKDIVSSLKEKLGRMSALFLTDYRGMTHKQLEDLRKVLKKADAEFVIAKNRLMKIAMEQTGDPSITPLIEHLNHPTATLFSYTDAVSAIKALDTFIKASQLPKVKAGLFERMLATEADFSRLATLPTRDVLLSLLVSRLHSPLFGLHFALSWHTRRFATVLSRIREKKS